MKFCPFCGFLNMTYRKMCIYCHKRFPEEQQPPIFKIQKQNSYQADIALQKFFNRLDNLESRIAKYLTQEQKARLKEKFQETIAIFREEP